MQEEDFITAGYVYKEGSGVSIVLGSQADGELQYHGHVTLGVTWAKVKKLDTNPHCPFELLPPEHCGEREVDGYAAAQFSGEADGSHAEEQQ